MNDQSPTPDQSLRIIEDAARQARQEKGDAAYYLMLWGALLAVFFFSDFAAAQWEPLRFLRSWAWLVFPLGGLLSYLHTRKTDQRETAKPLHDSLYMYTWGGVGICLGVWSLLVGMADPGYTPVLLLLFGFAAFVTGGVTKFYPSVAGGLLCVLAAAIALRLAAPYQNTVAAAGVLLATFVPGLLLYRKNKEQ